MIGEVFPIIAPVFICAAIGFAWARLGRRFDIELVTTLITSIAAPCLILSTLIEVEVEPWAFATMAAATLAALAAFAVIGGAILRASGHRIDAYLPALMFSNCGNMGLPVSLLAFGEAGLALAIIYFAIATVVQFTLGVGLAAGAASLGRLLRVPLLYAVALALVVMVSGIEPPVWFLNTIRLLGGITVPMMLISLGISLARLRVGSLGRSLWLSALRLVMGFAVGVALAWGFGFADAERGVLIVQAAMPVAVFNYLFALRYNTAPEEVAGMVVLSTILSFLTLPLLLLFVL